MFKLPAPFSLLFNIAVILIILYLGWDYILSYHDIRIERSLDAIASMGLLSRGMLEWLLDLFLAPDSHSSAIYEAMSLSPLAYVKYALTINLVLVLLTISPGLILLVIAASRCAKVIKTHHAYEHKSLFNILTWLSWIQQSSALMLIAACFWLNPCSPPITALLMCLLSLSTAFVVSCRRFTPF